MNRSLSKTKLITNSLLELGLEEDEGKGKGRYFVSKFIEAGLAHYKELGDILITKETLDKFIQTMVACPVIIDHEDVNDKNVDKLRVGVISRVWYNEADGWYYCEGILTDNEAIDLVKNKGWSVSCSYSFVSDDTQKTYHGKPIDMEFTDGEFLHLAIVETPRYEGANIVVNSSEERERVPAGSPEGGQFASKEGNEKENNEGFKPYTMDLIEKAKISGVENIKFSKDGYKMSFDIPQETFDTRGKKLFEILKSSPKIEQVDTFNVTDKDKRKGIFIQFKNNSASNSTDKENIIMSVMDDLKDFILGVVSNEKEDEMKVKNEDKRKLIDEIGGILKDKVDDEVIRTIIKKAEELSYEPSEDDKADNKCKNEDDEKEEKEAENKCKNEEDKEDKKVEDEEDKEKDPTKNEDDEEDKKEVKNSMKDFVMGGSNKVEEKPLYTSRAKRLEEGNKY